MALFKVTEIVDGSTIKVAGWQWNGYKGQTVKVVGYDIRGVDYETFAKKKLEILLNDKEVELKNVQRAEFSDPKGNDIIYCSVFLNDIDISQYFPELKAS